MPVDALAEILSNTRLAPDYNVVTFRAPQIAALAAPGQFVMVRCAQGLDPVLRRPFSIFEHVRDPEGRLVGLRRHDPADVAVPDALDGRVGVLHGVGVPVVQAMVARPPQRPLLGGREPAERQDELEHPGRLVGPVGEVAVVAAGDEEHPHPEGDEQELPVGPPDAREDRQHRDEVDEGERDGRHRAEALGGQSVRVGGQRVPLDGARPVPVVGVGRERAMAGH